MNCATGDFRHDSGMSILGDNAEYILSAPEVFGIFVTLDSETLCSELDILSISIYCNGDLKCSNIENSC